MKKYLLTIIFITASVLNGNSEGLMEADAGSREETLEQSKEILTNSFYSDNYIIKREALYGLRYVNDENIYLNILSIFNSQFPDYPGFEIIKNTALETLFYKDPERTILWLKNYNTFLEEYYNHVLYVFEPGLFFKTIGTENYYHFNNINFYLDNNADDITNIKILAEQSLRTGEEKYMLAVYDSFRSFDAFQYDILFSFFEDNGISQDIIYYNTAQDIPYFWPENTTEYTGTSQLKHILLEALLYRRGFTKNVYTKEFYINNPVFLYKNEDISTLENLYYGRQDNDITDFMGAELRELSDAEAELIEEYYSGSGYNENDFSLENKKTEYNMDLGKEGNPPYYLLCDAAAYFFAGVPEERHYDVFINNFDKISTELQLRFAEIIYSSPVNDIHKRIISFLSMDKNEDIRTLAFETYRKNRLFPDYLAAVLNSPNETVYNKFILIRASGASGDTGNISFLSSLLDSSNELLSVAAAGEILHLQSMY